MGVTVEYLGEGGALLKFQVLDLVVIVIYLACPELGSLIINHARLAVGDGDPDMHIFSGHMVLPPSSAQR